ncbi:hypothetical protein D3C83_312640 [compost metagenome]
MVAAGIAEEDEIRREVEIGEIALGIRQHVGGKAQPIERDERRAVAHHRFDMR